jgi:3-dehydroquinate synthetase
MSVDKKVRSGRVRLVLLAKLGEAYLCDDYPDSELHATLRAHLEP